MPSDLVLQTTQAAKRWAHAPVRAALPCWRLTGTAALAVMISITGCAGPPCPERQPVTMAAASTAASVVSKRVADSSLPEPKSDSETALIPDFIESSLLDRVCARETTGRPTVPQDFPFQSSDAVSHTATEFWSFRSLQRPVPPQVRGSDWVKNPIDNFLLARIEEQGLRPNPPVDRRMLARRVWFDLVGLPPTPEEVDRFVADAGPDAYERLVDRLLAAPQFGERWGRHWLDLARYADSNGYEYDEYRPNAYTYRDFVIWAFNADLPFDTFIKWQIAGDELDPDLPAAVAATGLCTAGPYNTFFTQKSERFDELDDVVSTIGSAMLGLTIGCARCHDHKYEPLPSRDYYGLVAVFAGTRRAERYLVPDGGKEYQRLAEPARTRRREKRAILEAKVREDKIDALDLNGEEKAILKIPVDPTNEQQARLLRWAGNRLDVHDKDITDQTRPREQDRARFEQLTAELARLEPSEPPEPPLGLVLDGSELVPSFLLQNGDPKRADEAVAPGFITVLTRGRPVWDDVAWTAWDPSDRAGDRPHLRTALANWLTDTEAGAGRLLARVIVNRLWQHHFGEGLVRTASNFGRQGDSPVQSELLDWLAGELIDNGWRLKHIHRLILTSAAYRQDTTVDATKLQIDPENRLFSRRQPLRLSAEVIRDALLAIGGNLNPQMYGRGIQPAIPRAAIFQVNQDANSSWPADVADGPAVWRRSVYIMHKRSNPVPLLQLFDAPDASASCARRSTSIVPTQALALWNEPLVRAQARRLAERALKSTPTRGQTPPAAAETIVSRVFLLALSRPPSQSETVQAVQFLERLAGDSSLSIDTIAELCQVLFLTNEFIYVD